MPFSPPKRIDGLPCDYPLQTAAESVALGSMVHDHEIRCPCYCEENVWRLAYRRYHHISSSSRQRPASNTNDSNYYAVFISNERKQVPMFYQRAAESPEKLCIWDYHVVLIGTQKDQSGRMHVLVYDVDTTLTPYPVSLNEYLEYTFSEQLSTTKTYYAPIFRVIPASKYLQYFASDRSHMYNAHTRSWNATPPPYQCIMPSSTAKSNLQHFWNVSSKIHIDHDLDFPPEALGRVMTLQELKNYDFSDSL